MHGAGRGLPRRSLLGAGAAFLVSRPLPVRAWAAAGHGLATTPAGFATDIRPPGLLHAVVARPPLLGWRLAGLDAFAARRVKGVVEIVPLAPWGGSGLAGLGGVAVLARDTWSAARGCDALRPVWEELASSEGACPHAGFFVPDTAESLMEPPSATVRVEDDRCTVWARFSEPERVRTDLAARLGLRLDAVTLHATIPAGGPDRTSNPAYAVEAALLSRAMGGAPVSLTWTRADDIPFRRRPAWA